MLRGLQVLVVAVLLGACVTVNVYFPEAAAQNAADRIVREIYELEEPPADDAEPPPSGALEPRPGRGEDDSLWMMPGPAVAAGPQGVGRVLEFLVPAASAQQPDINVSTPAIRALVSAMDKRHNKLRPHFDSGALGFDTNGMVAFRDDSKIPIRERNQVKGLVVQQNTARNDLYREIAAANGHPEWEPRIRQIFARRWVSNAPSGWWFQNASGAWTQK